MNKLFFLFGIFLGARAVAPKSTQLATQIRAAESEVARHERFVRELYRSRTDHLQRIREAGL